MVGARKVQSGENWFAKEADPERRFIVSEAFFSHMIYTNQRRFNGDIGDKKTSFVTVLVRTIEQFPRDS